MSRHVSAIVVAYKSGPLLEPCLNALVGRVAETVVVDNCPEARSGKHLRGRFPRVMWIDNGDNRGFAAAVNQGVAATDSPFVLLLNPDCELVTGLGDLVRAVQEPGVAGAGGLLVDLDGFPQSGFFARSLPTPAALAFEALGLNRLWPSNPANRRYRMLGMDPLAARDIEQPAGAFLLLKRSCLESLGGMDEGFRPVWFEDVDLCKRLLDAGYRMRYVPAVVARHAGGHAVATLTDSRRLDAWYGGLLRYAGKHLPRSSRVWVRVAVIAGLALRAARGCYLSGAASGASAQIAMLRRVASGFPGTAARR